MALDHTEEPPRTPAHLNTPPNWRWYPRRRVPLLRRRKVQTVRLGGKKSGRRRVLVALRTLKKIRLKWLKVQYRRMLRKLKEYYRNAVKEMMEAGVAIDKFQQRLLLETSFAVPTGVMFSTYPHHSFGPDRPGAIFII